MEKNLRAVGCSCLTLSNTKIKDAVLDLLDNRDGLMLGINSGFNALLKLGLLPYGEYRKIGQVEQH